jgi:type II secretory pathway pseudopilin PulG
MSIRQRVGGVVQRYSVRGFMLLGLLIVIALSSISLMAAVDVWKVQRQREREEQLIFAGDQYRQAIRNYYFSAPNGTSRVLPVSLEVLLDDDRYPIHVRHLRRLYPDPITGNTEWGEVRLGGRIAGVYSLSDAQPIKQAGFSLVDDHFSGSTSYQNWGFIFNGALQAAPGQASDINTMATPLEPGTKRSPMGTTK